MIINNFREILRENKFIVCIYNLFVDIQKKYHQKKQMATPHSFFNRQKGFSKMCFILAGYKPALYDKVFERALKFIPQNIDVCIVSSGKFDNTLKKLAEENDWSYLSIKRNCVSLAQNIVIELFPKAQLIFKMDEDIFLTKNCFNTLLKTYEKVSKDGDYRVGFVAPLLPINGYCHLRILKKLNLEHTFTKKFGKTIYAGCDDRFIEFNSDVAKFFWGENDYIPQIDLLNEKFQQETFSYTACPVRFSIGLILFSRNLWLNMGRFNVPGSGSAMGLDESQLCSYCICNSYAMIVAENTVAGHFSFSRQTSVMYDYLKENPQKFDLQN